MKNTQAFGLAVALACLGTPPAFALHKCTTKEGKVIYTEFECEKDAKASDVKIHDSGGFDTKKGTSPAKSSAAGGAPQKGPTKALGDGLKERDERYRQSIEEQRQKDIEDLAVEKSRKAAGGR